MTFANILDFVASLAVLALLAESYGILRRRLFGTALAPFAIGVLFGLMAVLQMHRPFSPIDGLIIDLRTVPIALAGAFLGWRGLLPCLAIAMGARLGIGGIGATAGLIGMVMAGLAGTIWARKMSHHTHRNYGMLMCLALAMSTSLLAGLALPRDLATWFFTTAASPLLALYLVAVPFIGSLLEREHRKIAKENRIKAALSTDPGSGLLTGPAFVRDVTSAFTAHPFGTFAGLLVITHRRNIFQRLLAQPGLSVERLAAIRNAAAEVMTHSDLAGFTADGSVFIPLTEQEVSRARTLSKAMDREIAARHAQSKTAQLVSNEMDLVVVSTPDPAAFLRLAERAALSEQPDWLSQFSRRQSKPRRLGQSSTLRKARIFDPAEHNALFAKADFLISRTDT